MNLEFQTCATLLLRSHLVPPSPPSLGRTRYPPSPSPVYRCKSQRRQEGQRRGVEVERRDPRDQDQGHLSDKRVRATEAPIDGGGEEGGNGDRPWLARYLGSGVGVILYHTLEWSHRGSHQESQRGAYQ